MIGMAENIMTPSNTLASDTTCTLGGPGQRGAKAWTIEGMYKFMDADFAGGLYNGYRFSLERM